MDWYRHKQAQNMNKTEKSVNLRKDEKVVRMLVVNVYEKS